MVTAELAPYSRATETADSVAALSRALVQLGHQVTVAMPKPAGLEASGVMVARRLTPLQVGEESVTVYDGQLTSGVSVVLLESDTLTAREDVFALDGKEADDNAERFCMLSKAALALTEQKGEGFDVIHCHDWPASFVTLLGGKTPTLFTIHNPDSAGSVSLKQLESWGIATDAALKEKLKLGARPNLLKGAALSADVATTITPSYAAALSSAVSGGEGGPLGEALTEAGLEVHGVLGGVDYSIFNPATDTSLAFRFDAEQSELKGSCKTAVCRELELEVDSERPLLVMVGNLDKDSGADLVVSAAPELLGQELQLIVAGAGGKALVKQLGAAKLRRASNYRFIETEKSADYRRLLGAADIALCAGRTIGSGHSVRVAQRYGAVPVATDMPGNRDSIVDCDPELTTGTGFLFADCSADGLRTAVGRALVATRLPSWGALRRRVVRQDLGWERPARRYAQLYRLAAQG